ncbi:centromere protein W [Salminus brasiliensis]|uniref:centromere protein W n=1 Tax=Salminus brasiliensis TaxID=930266 RepID=UPI003B83674E
MSNKKAPRAVLKSHMKKKPDIRVGKNADLMVQLNLLLVLHRLAEESRVKAFEEKTATIKVHHVRAVAKKLLKSTRG